MEMYPHHSIMLNSSVTLQMSNCVQLKETSLSWISGMSLLAEVLSDSPARGQPLKMKAKAQAYPM